ncbi:MAG: tRNA (adenosine(37)-N6)-dimethylallyltransferase MiaA, partial [Candidatus Margulisiibacteriota bacterium]
EIISADSMQVYRGMDIGTAKPTLEERQGILHHLIDIRSPDEEWTVSDFVERTKELRDQRAKKLIIVGGTGLYLWSLLNGYSFPLAPTDKEIRNRLEKEPISTLYAKLSTIDPAAVKRIHANDKKRIVRALEVYELTGRPISETQTSNPQTTDSGTQDYILVGINLPREKLYQRINQRVEDMIKKGLVEEVEGLLAKGYAKSLPSMQALGYKEVINYLEGKWTKEKMVEELKKRTRHFARRQMTWFRRFKNARWFEAVPRLPAGRQVDRKAILDYINSI